MDVPALDGTLPPPNLTGISACPPEEPCISHKPVARPQTARPGFAWVARLTPPTNGWTLRSIALRVGGDHADSH
jgi:hypothetical protein